MGYGSATPEIYTNRGAPAPFPVAHCRPTKTTHPKSRSGVAVGTVRPHITSRNLANPAPGHDVFITASDLPHLVSPDKKLTSHAVDWSPCATKINETCTHVTRRPERPDPQTDLKAGVNIKKNDWHALLSEHSRQRSCSASRSTNRLKSRRQHQKKN